MFTKILFPTDFSEKSEHALAVVKKLRDAGTKTVVLVHVLDQREMSTMADMEGFSSLRFEELLEEIRKAMRKKASRKLEEINRELDDLGFAVEERLVEGIPFTEILRIAEKEEVSAIVIGSTGKGLLSEMLLGSTSEKVVRESKRPVIVVK
ncbi:MAG TPA: universal stress protein [candidate division Zixibacteria bacterium]|nr:universal stress protein [candidate division Zixibacteria bacterium]